MNPRRQPLGVDDASVAARKRARDEIRLAEIQAKIRALSIVSTDRHNLAARYSALVTLEALLLERVAG
jgi:hypothetical protein